MSGPEDRTRATAGASAPEGEGRPLGLTDAQKRAAEADRSVAVVAGAGTGKTYMLARRYLYHLEQGLSPLEVVAATFTNRAAAELRARIRKLVRSRMPASEDVLAELEAAPIGTLHALALRICHDHPDAAGVPASFGILDEMEGRIWREEQLEIAIENLAAELFEHVPYDTVREAMRLLLDNPVEAEVILDASPDTWPALVERRRADAIATVVTANDWREARSLLGSVAGPDDDLAEVARRRALAAVEHFEAGRVGDALVEADFRTNVGQKKNWPGGELGALNDALRLVKRTVKDGCSKGLLALELGEIDDALAAALPYLRSAYAQVRRHLDHVKRSRRVLEFADHEAGALRALADPAVRAWYAARWKALLVDEFQDTNAVQEALIARLVEGMQVTIVGDEKQGIFGFRGAVAGVFERVREGIVAGGGDQVVLDTSFRTHAPLMARLNQLAGPMLGGMRQDLDADRKEAPGPYPLVRYLKVDAPRSSRKAQRLLLEARAVGNAIATMLAEGMPVFDKATDALRPVRAGDVAILARTWQTLDTYADVLPGLGIPVVHAGGSDLLATREAKDGLALLRFLAYPADDLALAAVLRSPFFAVADDVLARFALALEHERSRSRTEGADGDGAGLEHERSRFRTEGAAGDGAGLEQRGARAPGSWGPSSADEGEPVAPPDEEVPWPERPDQDAEPEDVDVAPTHGPRPTSADAVGGEGDGYRVRDDAPGTWWEALRLTPPTDLEHPVAVLTSLLDRTRVDPPSRLLQRADGATGYGAVVANLPGGLRREADWRGFGALVRTLEQGSQDVFAVDRALRRLVQAEIEVPRPDLEAHDAVSLMSIHRAKGLEWPVVVVADIGRRGGGRAPSVRADPALGIAFVLNDDDGERAKPALFEILEHDAAERERAETGRMAYVAITRARDRLLLAAADAGGGLLDALEPGLDMAGIVAEPIAYLPGEAVYPDPPAPLLAAQVDDGTWAKPASALGAGPGPAAFDAGLASEERWKLASELYESDRPEYLTALSALQRGGVPGPDEDGFCGYLHEDGRVRLDEPFVLRWRSGDAFIALVASAPAGARDEQVVVLDRTDPSSTLEALKAALQIEAGATAKQARPKPTAAPEGD